MTDSDVRTEEWKAIPGCSAYEASKATVWERGEDGRPVLVSGGFRSVDRIDRAGRHRKGAPLSTRLWGSYMFVDLRTDDGEKVPRQAHSVILETFAGPCPPGQECRHYDDNPLNCRWEPGTEAESVAAGGNLFYGTPGQNRKDGWRNNPGPPKPPPRMCACGRNVTKGSQRRCHECVKETGVAGARLLRKGRTPAEAAGMLGYSSPDGLLKLAVKYGGYRPPGRLRRALVTLRDGMRGQDA